MLGFKTEFDGGHTWSEDRVPDEVTISREGSGKWTSELFADRFRSLHAQAGNLQYYIVGVVRHDEVQVRSGPRLVVLMDKRLNVNAESAAVESNLGALLRLLYSTTLLVEPPSHVGYAFLKLAAYSSARS